MARASSVVLTSKKLSIAPSTHIDAGAELSEVEDEFMEGRRNLCFYRSLALTARQKL